MPVVVVGELRERKKILVAAITRLIEGDPTAVYTSRAVFGTADLRGWQKVVLKNLTDLGLIQKTGDRGSARYSVNDADGLRALEDSTEILMQILRQRHMTVESSETTEEDVDDYAPLPYAPPLTISEDADSDESLMQQTVAIVGAVLKAADNLMGRMGEIEKQISPTSNAGNDKSPAHTTRAILISIEEYLLQLMVSQENQNQLLQQIIKVQEEQKKLLDQALLKRG